MTNKEAEAAIHLLKMSLKSEKYLRDINEHLKALAEYTQDDFKGMSEKACLTIASAMGNFKDIAAIMSDYSDKIVALGEFYKKNGEPIAVHINN